MEVKDMIDEDDEIENAEFDGGVMTMSAQGMEYKDEDNEIDTVEYVCKVNREVLYGRMASQINKKLNESVQALQHGITDPLAFSFPSNEIARHFYNQLEAHGWCATLDQDNDLVRIDVVSSLDQAMKDKDDEDDDDIGDSGFFDDEVLSLK